MKRHPKNPLITRADIVSSHPALRDVSSVFNPGGLLWDGRILLLLRVQNRARETFLLKAVSTNGYEFEIDPNPIRVTGLEACPHRIFHIYDPRLTLLEGTCHAICAMDTAQGCYLGWFSTQDFSELAFRGLVSGPETRNGVLFPQRFEGDYLRFERPNAVTLDSGVKTGAAITCSRSADLLHWSPVAPVFRGRPHFWDELIGSGPPPLKTRRGWIHLYHGVATHFAPIYQMGVSLQDLREPWKTLSRGRCNILEPRELYEQVGQVPNVVFPTAAIPLRTDAEGCADEDSPVLVYYGAADTCVALAQTTIKELWEAAGET